VYVSVRFVMERIREDDETSAKAAPLQAPAITHGNNAANRLENEDDERVQARNSRAYHSLSDRACSGNHEYSSSFS
jgi:hypothetical protein